MLGDSAALAAVYDDANKNPDADFARPVSLFERAFQIFPATPSSRDRDELVGDAEPEQLRRTLKSRCRNRQEFSLSKRAWRRRSCASVLAQRLFRDAQQARLEAGSTDKLLIAQFGEAADWLEASFKSGDDGAFWPLYTIYNEGLGRPPSQQKVNEFLKLLALKDDPAAVALLAKSEESALGEKPASKPVGASR